MRVSCLVLAVALSAAAGGGSSSNSTTPSPITLLDTTVALVAGQNCNIGGMSRDFSGTAQTRVTITLTGSGLNIGVTLYAPDFATQLTGATGAGTATISSFLLTQNGTHHVSFCEANGVAGNVRVLVTQNP